MDRVKSSRLPTIKETLVPCWSPPWEVRRATMAFRLKAYFTILLLIHLFETSSCMMPLIRSREGGAPHSYTMTKVLDHGACETWSTTMRLEHCRRISTFLSYMCFPFALFSDSNTLVASSLSACAHEKGFASVHPRLWEWGTKPQTWPKKRQAREQGSLAFITSSYMR